MSKPLKFGYEGEGPMIGRRTAYASYPDVSVQTVVNQANLQDIDSIYFVVEGFPQEFAGDLLIADLGKVKVITVDYPVEFHCQLGLGRLPFVIRFVRCTEKTNTEDIPASLIGAAHTYIKMVCDDYLEFGRWVGKANEIAALGHTVLLMPDFWVDKPKALGSAMMDRFKYLNPRVRVCPPVHHILGTP